MQIGQAQELSIQAQMSEAGLQISVHIMAHFIHLYAATFSPAAGIVDKSDARSIVNMWHFKADDMDHIFGEQS